MIIKLWFLVFVILLSSSADVQEFKVDLSYKYLYSNQWDKLIQTYNLSRPFISEKQPFFKNGLNASLSYIYNSSKSFEHGVNVSYSYFRLR